MSRHAPQPVDIERVVVLSNPTCTRARAMETRIAELTESRYGKSLTILSTEPEREATEDKLRIALQPGDVLCVAGGDGTVNTAIRSAGKTPILPLGGGNGNDLANMLNGRPTNRPSRLLDRAGVVAIRPIQTDIVTEQNTATELAGAYVGIGAGALGAARLNEQKHRNKPFYNLAAGRFLHEMNTLIRAFAEADEFDIVCDSVKRQTYDITVANGPRIAKIGRPPVQLTEERIFAFEVPRKGFLPVAASIGGLMMGRVSGEYLSDERLELSLCQETVVQFDGEPHALAPDTQVIISQSEAPFYAISDRLIA